MFGASWPALTKSNAASSFGFIALGLKPAWKKS
jgi:hypothetical protein